MKYKDIYLASLFVLACTLTYAQQETFDLVSYRIPPTWQKRQVKGGVQLFVTDAKTGAYAVAVVTIGMASTGSADGDFSSQWKSLLVNTVSSISEPAMIEPVQDNGWDIRSGNGNYVEENVQGLATLITATGFNQTAAVVLITNTQQYQNELISFIQSLKLKELKPLQVDSTVKQESTSKERKSIVGLWHSYLNDTSGYMNGMAMYSGGYFRKEYLFNANGTYVYRLKNWSVTVKEILFVYESGTWVVNGTKLTLTPARGKGQWWSKASSNRTNEWGKLIRASNYILERQEYSFTIEYFYGSQDSVIVLKTNKATQRDGGNANTSEPNEFRYTLRKDGTMIDNPPGF